MSAAEPDAPEPFVRTFEVPAAAPWDQARAARLNARLGSPLAESEVLISIRRLEPWRSDAPGRYCAAYLRRSEVAGELTLPRDVDGRPLRLVFRSPQAARERRRRRSLDVGLGLLAVVLAALALSKAASTGAQARVAVARAEGSASRALAAQRAQGRRSRLADQLALAGAEGRTGADLAADLAWLARARQPGAPVRAVMWSQGRLAVRSVPTEQPPLAPAGRSIHPSPEGAGMWVVDPPPRPLAATFRPPGRPSTVSMP
jgi:hypothetical protein